MTGENIFHLLLLTFSFNRMKYIFQNKQLVQVYVRVEYYCSGDIVWNDALWIWYTYIEIYNGFLSSK